MQSYFTRLLLTCSATTTLLLGCGGEITSSGSSTTSSGSGATSSGSSASSTGAGATTGAGGGASTSAATGVGGGASTSAATGTGGATSSSVGAGGSAAFACSGATVSYAVDVAAIFSGCSGGNCHAYGGGFQNADSSYLYLVGKESKGCMDGRFLVAAGDPEHSYLVNKLTNHELCGGSPMPKGPGPGDAWNPRSDADIQTIFDWICTGAKND